MTPEYNAGVLTSHNKKQSHNTNMEVDGGRGGIVPTHSQPKQ
jgi:hypothetical protein